MKKIIFIAALSIFSCTAFAQSSDSNLQQSETKKLSISKLLDAYYGIKDALVSGNSLQAKTNAVAFNQTLKSFDATSLNTEGKASFVSLQSKIATDVQAIVDSKKIEDQRTVFASLSLNMWEMLKSENKLAQPAYQQYCPMKKSYWISNSTSIKNPYFGNQMLTCGKTTETIK